MLLTVILLSGTVLGATTIAGILTLYQTRQSTNVSDSAKAIFAADTGLEWELYKRFKEDELYPKPVMLNGTDFETASTTTSIKSSGFSDINHRIARAFQVDL